MPSCWHHISRRLRGEGEWLHVAGLLLQGGVGLTSAVHLSDPNLVLVPVPLSFPSSTANSTVRRGVKAPQQPCLRKGNRKAPLPLCLWTAAPSPRLLGALSSSGCCEDTGKRPGLGRRPRWAGRKTCFHATPSKVVWKQKEQKTRPYSHGWNVSPGVSALGLGCRLTHNAAPGPRRLEDLLLYKRRSLDSRSAQLIWGYFCRSLHFLPFVQTRAHCLNGTHAHLVERSERPDGGKADTWASE